MISIIVPVYNSQKYLSRCIESVLKQSSNDIELILVDDESVDNSLKVIDKYLKKDKRVKLICQRHSGVSTARNRGLNIAKGNLVMFLDSDDYIELNSLSKLVKLQNRSNADIVCTQPVSDEAKSSLFIYKLISRDKALKLFLNLKKISGYSWGKLYKKSLVSDLYFPEDMTYGEDGVFFLKALARSKKVAYSNFGFYHYEKRKNSLTGRNSDYGEKNLNSFLQINHVKKNIPEYLKKYIKVFEFSMYFSEMQIYERSSSKVKKDYSRQYEKMKNFCNSNWLDVLIISTNIRIKLLALKYYFISFINKVL